MFQTFRNAWKIIDLRKKILFTIFIIIIFRLGAALPSPFVDATILAGQFEDQTMIFGFLDLITGGSFSQATIFALGVTPYINASIIIQLLQVVIPALERWSKEGEEGRKKINLVTKFTSLALAIGLSVVYYFLLKNPPKGESPLQYTEGFAGWFSAIAIIAGLTAGAILINWLADQIDAKGIGSGMSLMIFAGIISGFAGAGMQLTRYFQVAAGTFEVDGVVQDAQPWYYVIVPVVLIIFAVMFFLIIITNAAERRIPVQYAKRVVGRKMYGGQNSNIPIKVNMTGVLPVIFASAFLSLPGTIQGFAKITTGFWASFLGFFTPDNWGYAVLYAVLIIGFNYFYVTIQYNPIQMANDLRKNSGMIPGIRPGQPTTTFISKVISKITFIGGIVLMLIAITPIVITKLTEVQVPLGGTSMLIVVGVALEISNTLESYMLMRHHKGFLE